MPWPFHAVLALAFLASGAALAQVSVPADQPPKHVRALLVAENATVAPGGKVTVALKQIIEKDWHTYWRNPGDSGAATTIAWQLPSGWSAGEIQWPYPSRIPTGPLMNFAYADQVMLLSDINVPKDAPLGDVMLSADAMWLVCNDVCVPEEAHLTLPLHVGAMSSQPDRENARDFAETRDRLPRPSPWQARYAANDTGFALAIDGADLTKAAPARAEFFPYTDAIIDAAAPQRVTQSDSGIRLSTGSGWRLNTMDKRAKIGSLTGLVVLASADGRVDSFEISAEPGSVPIESPAGEISAGLNLWWALLFAFLGGLILNLMPCVLPVLSMKALALAGKSGAIQAAHTESLAYGAGVVVCFLGLAGLLLGLRAGGDAVGWGFQYQQPIVVACFALLMLAVGLNLSGLFEITIGRFAGAGQKFATKGGALGSFFTGVLAVAVATPCTAPFMGVALGFALTASLPVALGIFFALGLGFALPFVLLGFSPGLLTLLPRPGPWMATFKQFLAFPMYGAALWLVWVLSQQTGPDGMLALFGAGLALAFAFWSYGAARNAHGLFGRVLGLGAALAAVVLVALLVPVIGEDAPQQQARAVEPGGLGYEAYSAERLASLRSAGRPVFVNATASWCITCLANERIALSRSQVEAAFAAQGVAALKADWTRQDPEITKLLMENGRSGVPLYLYFAPGAETPMVLPQVLTETIVLSAIGAL